MEPIGLAIEPQMELLVFFFFFPDGSQLVHPLVGLLDLVQVLLRQTAIHSTGRFLVVSWVF